MPRTNGGSPDLEALAARLDSMSREPPPPETKALLYKLFEAVQFVEHSVGRLMAEVAGCRADITKLQTRMRDSRRKLDSVTGEIEDTRSFELRTLREDRRRFIWLIIGALVAGLIGALLRHLFGK